MEEQIEILKSEYDKLKKASLMLQALEEGGVDNWDWHGEAMQRYEELLQENGYDPE